MKKKLWIFLIASAFIAVPLMIHWASTELDTAVTWLNTNGLTQYTTATTFKATINIRRDEAAKFFSVFAKNILKKADISTSSSCSRLSDVSNSNTMRSYILDTCSRGYIMWSAGKFTPWASLSNEQAIAIIIRMLDGKKYDESWPSRSSMYYQRAEYLWLSAGLSLSNKKGAISRGILGILLYRAWQPAMTNTINSTLSDKPDLILDSVWLNSGYPSPKVNDEHFYVDLTVKNLGKSISFSATTKWIFSCSNNGVEIIHKEIVNWTIKQNGVFSVGWITNTPNPSIYLFITPESNYTVNCSFQLQSATVQESNANNNSKSFSFAVGTTSSSNTNQSSGSATTTSTVSAADFDEVNAIWAEALMMWTNIMQSNRLGYIVKKNGKYGYVDSQRHLTINTEYDGIIIYSIVWDRVLLIVKKEKVAGSYDYTMWLMDNNWQIIVPIENSSMVANWSSVTPWNYVGFRKNGFCGLVDQNWNVIFQADTYSQISPIISTLSDATINQNVFLVEKDGKLWLINRHGDSIIAPQYYNDQILWPKLIAFRGLSKWWLFKLDGTEVLPVSYDNISMGFNNQTREYYILVRQNFDSWSDQRMDFDGNWITQ